MGGKGYDGKWAKHTGFKVLEVKRIEHGHTWVSYRRTAHSMWPMRTMFFHMDSDERKAAEQTMKKVKSINANWKKQSPRVKAFLNSLHLESNWFRYLQSVLKCFRLEQYLKDWIEPLTYRNETLLFHGCPGKNAKDQNGTNLYPYPHKAPRDAIMRRGFDDRLGSLSGMLGSGLYFADKASKADQYAGKYGLPEETTVGEEAEIFLVRVSLGLVYSTKVSLNEMRRPPCIKNHFDANLEWIEGKPELAKFGAKPWKDKGLKFLMCDHIRYDSVMSEGVVDNRKKVYNEYAVFSKAAYPEFKVKYKRI